MDAVNTFLEPLQAAAEAVRVENFLVPGFVDPIPARLYHPIAVASNKSQKAELLPAVLYFHGGGFCSGSLDDADVPARFIAQHAHAVVLSIACTHWPRAAPSRPRRKMRMPHRYGCLKTPVAEDRPGAYRRGR